jgi:hypothetical protein
MIVLDTSVLSLAFRRRSLPGEVSEVRQLRRLVQEDAPLVVPGIVTQELLSGVRSDEEFQKLQRHLAGFSVLLAGAQDHVQAARIANACRRKGLVASAVDCLIAALTVSHAASLFTTDADFQQIARCCELQLLRI